MRKSKYCVIILALVFALSSTIPAYVFASSQTRNPNSINISDGQIAGEKIEYYFTIPETVLEFVTAERMSIGTSKTLIEKFKLSCLPDPALEVSEAPSTLVYISVYKKLAWKPTNGMQELFKTNDYVFVLENAISSFKNSYNIDRFSYCMNHLGSPDVIRNLFRLPESQQIEYSETVFLNGNALNTKLIISGNTYYLPFRELCESLGYTVEWVAKERRVVLKKENFRDSFIMNADTRYVNNKHVMLVNDKTYMSVWYFILELSLSTEFGRNKNVYITK